jgi:glycosyltransferase involved in cell wall biosynthesis
MKILYLYAEVMGYTIATLNELSKPDNEVHVVCWDLKKLTPFQHSSVKNIHFYNRSEFNNYQLLLFVQNLKPSIIVISGWIDKGYLRVAIINKKNGIPIVTGLDSQWKASFKQHIASTFNFILKFFFSYVWVAGPMQYEYARRLGFNKDKIIYNLYSANLDLFNNSYFTSIEKKRIKMPHRFLFVGRFETVKSLDLLLNVWHALKNERKDWVLHLIGEGSMKLSDKNLDNVMISNFLQPEDLIKEVRNSGCFVLPSSYEPWGVVIHEFAAAGLPIICSDKCGASSEFVINGYNGFVFKSGQYKSLYDSMIKMINLSDAMLNNLSENSNKLAQRITPISSAKNLLSILK